MASRAPRSAPEATWASVAISHRQCYAISSTARWNPADRVLVTLTSPEMRSTEDRAPDYTPQPERRLELGHSFFPRISAIVTRNGATIRP